MKKIFTLFIVLLFLTPAFGQKTKNDIVYLKSGAIIKGQLITYDAETVKINSAGNLWVFKVAEVDSVSRYKKPVHEKVAGNNYFFDVSAGVLKGNPDNSRSAPFSFTASFQVKVAGRLYAGAGIGAEFMEETYMPAFAQFQYRLRDSRFTPVVNLQTGYEVPLEESRQNQPYVYYDIYYPYPQNNGKLHANGGFLINPSFGFHQTISENFGWFFAFGYRYHRLSYSGENSYRLEKNYSRLSLKIGFTFK